MYRLNEDGKEAVVFVSEKELQEDPGTLKQIRQMVSDPTVDHARVMPDCHVATSCCVGFTARLTNKVCEDSVMHRMMMLGRFCNYL